MAKRNSYESKRPVTGTPDQGVSVREVLAKSAGKSSGEELTMDDIRNIVSKSNMSARDARRTIKGGKQIVDSGLEHRMMSPGTYNVFDGDAPMDRSSRKAGNLKGKDFMGDSFLKTGRNVSLAVGLAESLQSAKKESAAPTTAPKIEDTPAAVGTTNDNWWKPADNSAKGGTTKTETKTKSKSGGPMTAEEILKFQKDSGFWENLSDFKKKYNTPDEYDVNEPAVPINQINMSTQPGGKEIVSTIQKRQASERDKKYQSDYSNFLKTKYSNVFNYLTNKGTTNTNSGKALLKKDFEKIGQTQPNLYQYLIQHHADQLKNTGMSFKKGGVIKGVNGIKTPLFDMSAIAPEGSTPVTLENSPSYQSGEYIGQDYMKKATPTYTTPTVSNGAYGTEQPGDYNPFGEGSKGLDVAGTVGKHALPFIGEAMRRKAWKNVKPINFTPAQYLTGTVRDLPMPNLNLRARNPTGPDVQSEITAMKFGDAQQRDAGANYQIQNAMSKLEQENQIKARTNEGLARNQQGRLQTDMMNAQMNIHKAQAMGDSYAEPFVTGQQHLNQDMSSRAYLDYTKKAGLAEQIFKSGNTKDPMYQYALKWINAGKGAKMKV